MIKKLIFVLLFFVLLAGVSGALRAMDVEKKEPAANQEELSQDKAKNSLMKLVSAYEKKNERRFMNLISEKFYPFAYAEFQYRIKEDFRQLNNIDIALFIDKVVPDSQYTAIQTHWMFNYLPKDQANILRREGRTVFTFAKEEDGLKLIDTKGDTLFGFTP